MKRVKVILLSSAMLLAASAAAIPAQRMQERLDRGVLAVKVNGTNNAFVSWRLFSSDPINVKFNLYKNAEETPVNPQPLDAAHTNYTVADGATVGTTYSVAVLYNNVEVYRSASVGVWQNTLNNSAYLEIAVQKPTGRVYNYSTKTFSTYTDYTIFDGTVADLDGDGEYEIVFFWGPANMQDNTGGVTTGNVFIDAYKLNGAKLWGANRYIDLGPNIRAGAHYNTFSVFDFDGNGKAEIIVKTADGTKDTKGTQIGNNNVYINSSGMILDGAEYLSCFDGATGQLLDTKPYEVSRHPDKLNPTGAELNAIWGDNYGNRCDRYLSAVAYLDGVRPSAVMCRGYYTRSVLCAWDWDGKELKKRWLFDTRGMANGSRYEGQGNHNLSVADVDGDGKDEIIYGAMVVNSDGTPRFSTQMKHGDAMHVGKHDPYRPGLQVMRSRESSPYGIHMYDAATGEEIWSQTAGGDTGRGICADIDPEYPGAESWGASGTGTWAADGTRLRSGNAVGSMNMAIYWDGDTGRELFDGQSNPSVSKVTASGVTPNRSYSSSAIATFSGASTNGGTKANPCLQADILGDWREELILRKSDNTALRIYTTTMPTAHSGDGAVPSWGIPTLMHNKAYRLAIAWQHAGYNQPPHLDYFLGYGMDNVSRDESGAAITVSFNPNGGKFAGDVTTPIEVSTVSGAPIDIPSVSRGDGKAFVGWYFANGDTYNPTTLYMENMELKAMWEPTFTLSFDANGGSMADADSKLVFGGEPIGAIPTPTKFGQVFAGWNTAADGSGTTYTASSLYDQTANLTLYAQWDVAAYLLTLNATGGTVNPIAVAVTYDSLVGELPTPVRFGYEFEGWNSQLDGAGDAYVDSTVYKLASDATIYAIWRALPVFTITFNPNGGELSPDSTTKLVVYDKAVGALPTPTRSAARFLSWNTQQNGRGFTYTDATIYEFGIDIVLYAQWEAATSVSNEAWSPLAVYPNPVTSGTLRIESRALKAGEDVKIYGISGTHVATYKVEGETTSIDVSHLSDGVYVLKVGDYTAKFVKQE